MDDLDPSIFDARRFFAQVRGGGLALPDRVEDENVERLAWKAWHGYLARREEPGWFFDSDRFGGAINSYWPGLARVWVDLSDRLIAGTMPHASLRVPFVPGEGIDWEANPNASYEWCGLHYMFFLRWPIRAALLTGDGCHVRAVGDCLRSYLEQMDGLRDVHNVYRQGSVKGGHFTVWNTLAEGAEAACPAAYLEGVSGVRDCRASRRVGCRASG